MKENYTHIAMVIDRSGSMSSCWADVQGGYSELVKINKDAEGECTFTLTVFDDHYDVLEDFTPISDVKEKLDSFPRGSTALLDAIGKTIKSVGDKLAKMDEKDRPSKVIFMVNTDGQENASREYTKDVIKKMIDEQTNTYKWVFQFIGASLASVNEAKSWGFSAGNTSTYSTDNSTRTFGLVGEKMKNMRFAQTYDCYVAAAAFTEEDRSVLNEGKI